MKTMKPKRRILDTDTIQPAALRQAVRRSQEQNACTSELATFLMNIHDIVIRTQSFFANTSEEEREEAKSYSLERWLVSGIYKIDLKTHDNPFSYIYAGVYLNMLNRIMRMRKREAAREQYERKVLEEFRSQFPGLKLEHANGDNY